MDLGTIIGIVVGITLMIVSIMMGTSLLSYVDIPSVMIVFGGATAGTLVAYPIKEVANFFNVTKHAFTHKIESPVEIIQQIVAISRLARTKGFSALEEEISKVKNEFFRKALVLIVDRTPPDVLRNILERDMAFVQSRHDKGIKVVKMFATLAPSFGMIGTLIGLVAMFKVLDDPKKIGPGMAVAILTTFYGALVTYLFLNPIAEKLKWRSDEELVNKAIILEGILRIQANENSVMIEEALTIFLSPVLRKKLKQQQEQPPAQEKK